MSAAPAISRLAVAALRYAQQGWFVFPLKPREKQPLSQRGFQDATTDAKTIGGWWQRWPDANIGLWPGPSKLFVVDIDGPIGEQTASALGLLAEPTLTCVTGRKDGGRHLYFHGPGFPVSNVDLGPGLDIRSHGGYVVVPPSIHPSGAPYTWSGRVEELRELPDNVLARLRETTGHTGTAVAPLNVGDSIGEGGRNNTLTRIAGRLLAKHPLAETVELLWACNVANCRPPLDRREVEAIVASLAQREARKPSRQTGTGQTLAIAQPGEDLEDERLDPVAYATAQADRAIARQREDLSGSPQWFARDLRDLVGPMLPGELHVVGALMGNGKTTFAFSALEYLVANAYPTLYLPLEVDVEDTRRRLAAWALQIPWKHVARNAVDEEAAAAIEARLRHDATVRHMQFPDDRRVSLERLAHWMRWGAEEFGAKVAFIDHFHRMDFGAVGINYRVQVTETVRALKDLAREHRMVIIATAQLNRDAAAPLDRYYPPTLGRLKESSGIGEEADSVLMLSRVLRGEVDAQTMRMIMQGHVKERDYEEANAMRVTCRKHRIDDDARDQHVRLAVTDGRATDRYYWGNA